MSTRKVVAICLYQVSQHVKQATVSRVEIGKFKGSSHLSSVLALKKQPIFRLVCHIPKHFFHPQGFGGRQRESSCCTGAGTGSRFAPRLTPRLTQPRAKGVSSFCLKQSTDQTMTTATLIEGFASKKHQSHGSWPTSLYIPAFPGFSASHFGCPLVSYA